MKITARVKPLIIGFDPLVFKSKKIPGRIQYAGELVMSKMWLACNDLNILRKNEFKQTIVDLCILFDAG